MSTGIKINPRHWNDGKQAIREIAGHFEYSGYNAKLNRYRQSVKKSYSYFESRAESPSVLQMKSKIYEFMDDTLKLAASKPMTVIQFIRHHIEFCESNGLKYGTISGFKQLQKVIEKMDNSQSLEFKDMNEYRMHEMVKLMVERFDYSTDQINKIQKKLITVVNRAKENPIYEVNQTFYTRNPSWKVKPKGSSASGRGLAFTPDELRKIESVELIERLDKVRDRFLIGVDTGQRYSDFSRLNNDYVVKIRNVKHWDFVQTKTKAKLKIAVSKRCLAILEKYDGYPPTISMTNFNRYLKEVCELAEINDIQIVRKQNPLKGVISEERIPKWKLASSHDCRRTLATLMNNEATPLTTIMRITGHKNIGELQKYLKVNREAPIVEATNLY